MPFMAGNEIEVTRFLFNNVGLRLCHLGSVGSIGLPTNDSWGSYENIEKEGDIDRVRTQDSNKKADIYINGVGVSIKQAPTSPLYNRLQRANIVDTFQKAGLSDVEGRVAYLDREIAKYQSGKLKSRDVPWPGVFPETDFKALLKLLMMEYSPNYGHSTHPAKYILEAPSPLKTASAIQVYSFSEYFDAHKDKIVVSLRRSWAGQASKSEHSRAVGLISKEANAPWVFNGAGYGRGPRGWMPDWPESKRQTAYYIIIYKNA